MNTQGSTTGTAGLEALDRLAAARDGLNMILEGRIVPTVDILRSIERLVANARGWL